MESLPTDFLALLGLVFVLGVKHGFDADHLATIDGLTRHNAAHNPRLARYCGTFFSLGHGGVVMAVALAVSVLASHWQVPAWLEHVGAWISIGVLGLLGWVNLRAVLNAPTGQVVVPVAGPKGKLLGGLQKTGHPVLIAAVGALFALSYDTMSQAALFAMTAGQFGGWRANLALGAAFMFGMLICDGLNGLWISRLLRRSDQMAVVASRLMGLTIAAIALLVAAFGLARYVAPPVAAWAAEAEFAFGIALVAVVLCSFTMAAHLSRQCMPAALRR
jgi:nickel/cobalt transporter (NiCoT) family protein